MFSVILSGAKQYLVKKGDIIDVELLSTEAGGIHTFQRVIATSTNGKDIELGAPFLQKKVQGKVIEHGKHDKIRVGKMKAKKNYRRVYGHRQPYSRVEITEIA